MCFKFAVLAVVCTIAVMSTSGAELAKDKRQVGAISVAKEDHQVAESGFAGPAAVQAGSKFFQDIYMAQHSPDEIEFGHVCETPKDWEQRYAHVPAKDHYEHGHKRGNDHHFIERHEKAHPHAGEFKTKVRWGDKHGGYGEHYWDYNHAGHGHDGDGEESKQSEEYAAYEEDAASQKVPTFAAPGTSSRGKREPGASEDDAVEFISPSARSLVLSGKTGRHGGNLVSERDYERGKREHKVVGGRISGEDLIYEPRRGVIVDQKSGLAYELKPVDY